MVRSEQTIKRNALADYNGERENGYRTSAPEERAYLSKTIVAWLENWRTNTFVCIKFISSDALQIFHDATLSSVAEENGVTFRIFRYVTSTRFYY